MRGRPEIVGTRKRYLGGTVQHSVICLNCRTRGRFGDRYDGEWCLIDIKEALAVAFIEIFKDWAQSLLRNLSKVLENSETPGETCGIFCRRCILFRPSCCES